MADSGAPEADVKKTARRRPSHLADAKDPFYIQAVSPLADERNRVLKHGDTFAVWDHYGDIKPTGLGEEGIYHEGTRYLSCLLLALGKERPLFLSSTVKDDNDFLAVDLTNPDVTENGRVVTSRGTLHVARTKFLWDGVCYERFHVRNYGLEPIRASFTLHFEADYADIFEVRGAKRKERGQYLEGEVGGEQVVLGYRGLDGVTRRTRFLFQPAPASLTEAEARFEVALPPHGETDFFMTVVCERDEAPASRLPYAEALRAAEQHLAEARQQFCTLRSTDEFFNAWAGRAGADLHMMMTATPQGPYPYAGVPWFSTPFGRDGVITAWEMLWLDPGPARGVLAFLAARQATETNPERDAEPGKILHEMRQGEMAALKEIPFGLYYGSVDSTPLFLVLAGAYYQRTGDKRFIASLWPHVEAALRWIDTSGDPDKDGFVEYYRRSPKGLVQQGWKDSHDAIFHADGRLAEGPIALCEVQGYVYAAKQAAADLAEALGRHDQAADLWQEAIDLRERFEQAFWLEDLGTYALALDGEKHPCRVRTSNPGHCLLTGIARRDRARRVAETLLQPESFSGWGIRTVATTEARYNPMAYHDGSIWPHDNALIAQGLARYGLKEGVLKVFTGLFDASQYFDLHRLPELFCGFCRRPGEGPTLYPVACAPQAWSSAAVFQLVQACLGLTVDGCEKQIRFTHPELPPFLSELHVRNLRVGPAVVDLLLLRHGHDVGINVLRREGEVEILLRK